MSNMKIKPGPRPGMTLEDRFWEKVKFSQEDEGCHEWQGALSVELGYGMFNDNGKTVKAHRFAWKLAFGKYSERCVCHKCDNPKCVRIDHLFEGDYLDNNQDMVRKERHGRMKFTHAKVRRLRSLYSRHKDILSHRRIAEWFGVSKATISHLLGGRNWAMAEGEPATGEGKRRYNTKLDAEKVREIRRRRALGEKLSSLSCAFGVCESKISKIARGECWNHV